MREMKGHTLKTTVRLQEEIRIKNRRDAAINDGSRSRVSSLILSGVVDRIETGVVTFAGDYDRKFRAERSLGCPKVLEGLLDFHQFVSDDDLELPFGNAVAEEDDALGQLLRFHLVRLDTLDDHVRKVSDHL